MITAEMEVEPCVDDIDGVLEDYSERKYAYPPELIERWVKIADDADLKIASGELKPQTVEEFAAELGITLD